MMEGKKDRTVPLPEKIIPASKMHLESVIDLHQNDMGTGYAGTFVPSLLEKNTEMLPKIWPNNGFSRQRP